MENNILTNHQRVPLSWLGHPHPRTESVVERTEIIEQNSEIAPENGIRDSTGKLLPGHPGLPGAGRKPSDRISEAYNEILRRDGALKYAEVIANDAVGAKAPRDRLAAVSEMTAYTEGKPMQNVRMAGVFMVAAPESAVLESVFGAELDSE